MTYNQDQVPTAPHHMPSSPPPTAPYAAPAVPGWEPSYRAAPAYYPPAPVQQVVSLSNNQASRCRHGLHFVLTILTGGLWLPIWILDAIVKGKA